MTKFIKFKQNNAFPEGGNSGFTWEVFLDSECTNSTGKTGLVTEPQLKDAIRNKYEHYFEGFSLDASRLVDVDEVVFEVH